MNKHKKTAIILLSGGLDSAVSLAKSDCDIKLGIIFNYGHKAYKKELAAAKNLAEYYGFHLLPIRLSWLKGITSIK